MMRILLSAAAIVLAARCYAADAPPTLNLAGSKDSSWSDLLLDVAPGSVSAAGMLGLSGESVTTIENVRNVVVALQGLGSNDDDTALGISITPARTSLLPMDLSRYADSWFMRMLGSLTFSYAQGPATIESADYERKAYAIDTNWFPSANDDPLIAAARALETCTIFPATPPDGPPSTGSAVETVEGPAAVPAPAPSEDAKAVDEAATACINKNKAKQRWNRTQVSLSYGDARIRPKDDSKPEDSLGRTLALNVIYGFDQFPKLRERYALTLSYRRTEDEPVLETLAQPQTVYEDSSLFVARLSGGNSKARILVEVSDVRAHDITASQRAFKQALGVDCNVFEGVWLNLRFGKQRKVDGSGTESGTLLTLSYSPKALLTTQ